MRLLLLVIDIHQVIQRIIAIRYHHSIIIVMRRHTRRLLLLISWIILSDLLLVRVQ